MNYNNINELVESIENNLDNSYVNLVYAFNGTGKTRISSLIQQEDINASVLCFNSFIEDLLIWDNENLLLQFNNSSIKQYIEDEGIEKEVIDNFKKIIVNKVEPEFLWENDCIKFYIKGSELNENIKISRGEESIFKWSIFYTVLESAISQISLAIDERSSHAFDNLRYIIIDDPVSSIDDTNIVQLALQIYNLVKEYKGKSQISFLITTHHPLFYNVLYNSLRNDPNLSKNCKFKILKTLKDKYVYDNQKNDSPFGYHLVLIEEIKKAIINNSIQKYHFNLFRTLLEKTANFFGYTTYYNCINIKDERKKEFIRVINLFSHGKLSDLESKDLNEHEIELFKEVFNQFLNDYKWSDKYE